MIDFSQFKVRCSAINKVQSNSAQNPVLTEKQAIRLDELEKKESLTNKQQVEMAELLVKKDNGTQVILSTTCIEYLMEAYAWETQGMIPVNKESLDILSIRKGKTEESEARILLTRVDKLSYEVHKERISNEYLSGEIDLYVGEQVYAAENITDIKNSFDYPTFLKKIHTGLETGQREQVAGYGDITGAQELYIANCLVDCPFEVIEEMRWKVAKKMNAVTLESPEFLAEWPKWERSMIFNHIPIQQRVSKIKVEPFSEFERQKLYDRVKICREWLNNFHEQYQKLS